MFCHCDLGLKNSSTEASELKGAVRFCVYICYYAPLTNEVTPFQIWASAVTLAFFILHALAFYAKLWRRLPMTM